MVVYPQCQLVRRLAAEQQRRKDREQAVPAAHIKSLRKILLFFRAIYYNRKGGAGTGGLCGMQVLAIMAEIRLREK